MFDLLPIPQPSEPVWSWLVPITTAIQLWQPGVPLDARHAGRIDGVDGKRHSPVHVDVWLCRTEGAFDAGLGAPVWTDHDASVPDGLIGNR